MKLGFRYNSDGGTNGGPDVAVFNAETGETVELVTGVSFLMAAGDHAPTMCIQCFPSQVEINGVEATEVTPEDMNMFVARSRSIDLDGVNPNQQ